MGERANTTSNELSVAIERACEVLDTLYFQYQRKIGPYASQAHDAAMKLRDAAKSGGHANIPSKNETLMMADGTPLYDYLRETVPESTVMDEWTRGYEECKRRLFKIIGPQLSVAVCHALEPQS